MKNNILYIFLIGFLLTGLNSCKRDYTMIAGYLPVKGTSQVKVLDLSPSFRKVYNAADSFNVLINGSVINSPFLSFSSIFPASGTSFGYVSVPSGLDTFNLVTPGKLTGDSLPIASVTQQLLKDSSYTFMVLDSGFVFLHDSYTPPLTGYFNLRLVHAALNDTAGKSIDIYSTRYNSTIFKNIKPGTNTFFTSFAYNAQLNDTLYVRRTGSNTITLDTLNAVSFTNQRTYTLYYKGDATTNWTTNAKRRHLAVYVNQ